MGDAPANRSIEFINAKKTYTSNGKIGVIADHQDFKTLDFSKCIRHGKWTAKAEQTFGPSRVWSDLRDEIRNYAHDKIPIYSFYMFTNMQQLTADKNLQKRQLLEDFFRQLRIHNKEESNLELDNSDNNIDSVNHLA
jgi:hypothetical protein